MKKVKFLSIMVAIAFLWQECARAYPDQIYLLRPMALSERKILGVATTSANVNVAFSFNGVETHEVKIDLNRLRADFGFLPQDHPLVSYLRQLVAELYPNLKPEQRPRIEVLASAGYGVSAEVFANNTIVISPEFLQFIHHKEELLFVLCHELMHMDKEHFQKMEDIKKKNDLRELLGLVRYQEYEADVAAIHMLDERDININGAITLFKRLRRAGVSWGPVHGAETDRLLNIETITFAKDIEALSYLLTNMPAGYSKAVMGVADVIGNRITQVTEYSNVRNNSENRRRIAQNADIYLNQEAIPQLISQIERDVENLKKSKISESDLMSAVAVRLNENRTILAMLVQRARDSIRTQTGQDSNFIHFAAMDLVFGIPFFEQIRIGNLNIPALSNIRENFLDDIQRNFPAILGIIKKQLLERDVLKQAGFLVRDEKGRLDFIRKIFNLALESLVYDTEDGLDFNRYLNDAFGLLNSIKGKAQETGVEDSDIEWLWTEIVFRGIFTLFDLRQGDKILPYLKAIKTLSSSLSIDCSHLDYLISRYGNIVKRDILQPLLQEAGLEYFYPKPEEAKDEFTEILSKDYKTMDEMYKAITECMKQHTLDEFVASLKKIMATDPKCMQDILDKICEIIRYDIAQGERLPDILPGQTAKEKIISYIQFLLAFIDSTEVYNDVISNFFDEFWCCNNDDIKTLGLQDIEEITSVITDIASAEKRFNVSPQLSESELSEIRPEKIPELGCTILRILYETLNRCQDKDEFFETLASFLSRWSIIRPERIIMLDEPDPIAIAKAISYFEEIGKMGLAHIGLDVAGRKDFDTETLRRLFMVSFLCRDIFIMNSVQEYLLPRLLEGLSFDEALSFLESAYLPQQRAGYLHAWEYMIEEKAQTPAQMEMLTEKVHNMFKAEERDALKYIGTAVGIDGFMEKMFRNNLFALETLMKSGQDDKQLKNFLFTIWWPAYSEHILSKMPHSNSSKQKLRGWARTKPMKDLSRFDRDQWLGLKWYMPLPEILNIFYNMDYKGRYLLLRKLLMAKNGVLTKDESRVALLGSFMEDFVKFQEDEQDVRVVIHDVLREFIAAAQDDQLYFALYPLLIDRIANPPQKPSPWKRATEFRNVVKKVTEYDEGAIRKKMRSALTTRMLTWVYGYTPTKTHKREEELDAFLLSVIPEESRQRNGRQLGTMSLILEIAQRLGSPGVRFLQLLGQFIELPAQYEAEFMNVYDSMVGQSRLSAYHTLKRECPEYVKQIKKIKPRVGGGSLMTVYEVELNDGTREAVKVLNPNAEYFAKECLELLEKVLTELSKKDERYGQALPLLDDLREWIAADLHDDTFIEDDKVFKKDNDGYRPKGFDYSIAVPQTMQTGSRRVIRERFVEGGNLTRFKPALDCTSLELAQQQEVVSLIARNYFDQIFLGGFSSPLKAAQMLLSERASLVHSDVHPGNFRVDGKGVNILDRASYIKLTHKDRRLLLDINKCTSMAGRLEVFINYLSTLPGNEQLKDKAERDKIISSILKEMPKETMDLEKAVLNIIIQLKKHKIKIPLKITRLIKNLNGLKRLATRVGFSSLREALEFIPSKAPAKARPATPRQLRKVLEAI